MEQILVIVTTRSVSCLSWRRWLRKLCTFYRILRNKSPGHLCKFILPGDRAYLTWNSNTLTSGRFFVDQNIFLTLFFPIRLRSGINCNSESYSVFQISLLKSIRTIPNNAFNVANIYGIKLLTRLCVGLSHLRERKFRHNSQDTINPLCPCSLEIESTSHFFLCYQNFIPRRTNLMNELCRSSHRRCSVKRMFLKILQNSQENTCARVSFLIKRLWYRCFPVNFAKFSRTPIL